MALGYPAGASEFAATLGVDAILPLGSLETEGTNPDFWEAQQRANAELESSGLYLTHLFRETDVILTPEWLSHRVRVPLGLSRLEVFRPATLA